MSVLSAIDDHSYCHRHKYGWMLVGVLLGQLAVLAGRGLFLLTHGPICAHVIGGG